MKPRILQHNRFEHQLLRLIVYGALVLLPVIGLTFQFSPTLAQRASHKLVDILQVEGKWLGFIPINFEPMPSSMPLSTTSPQAAPATGPLYVDPYNPRYFTDGSGRVVYLTGSHTWSNLQDMGDGDPPPVFDYTGFLDFLEGQHHNFFRLWIMEQARWGSWNGIDGFRFAPHPYPRSGPGTALDGKPKFNLSQFNQAYFDRMRQRTIEAGQRGMYVSVMLFDGWSIEDKGLWGNNPWRGHPFNQANNITGVNGDPNGDGQGLEIQMLSVPAITTLQEAYVRKVVDTVNDLDNVLYEISNEGSATSTDWQYHMIQYIKSYEATKPKQHPVGMTVQWPWPNGSPEQANAVLFASPADWVSPAGELYNRPVATGNKVILADTDHLCGICGDRMWVWMSFTRGENPLFMDVWSCAPWWYPGDCNRPAWPSLRQNLGYTRDYANRINLAAMKPRGDLCSSQYCLANAAVNGAEYLVYMPDGGSVTVNLTATPGTLAVEWFNPSNGTTVTAGAVTGGASRSFQAPFSGDAVLYLRQTSTCYDFNRNGTVDASDLSAVAVRWPLTILNPDPDGNPGTPNYESLYDVNSDGQIDEVDIQRVASRWNQSC